MKQFIHWTGIISLVSGASLQFPAVAARLMPTESAGMLMHVFGVMAMFIGITLIICARDLGTRAPIVMWEGVLRLAGFALMTGYGLFWGGGVGLVASGILDGTVGILYLVLLPRHLRRGTVDLLFDRR
jgi:hypothetical protein